MQQTDDPRTKIVQLIREAACSADDAPPTAPPRRPDRFWNTVARWGYLALMLPAIYMAWVAGIAMDTETALSGKVSLIILFGIGPVIAALSLIAAIRHWRAWWNASRGEVQP